jgi:hypothetical protein
LDGKTTNAYRISVGKALRNHLEDCEGDGE